MDSESEEECVYEEEEDRPAPSSVRKYDIEEYSVVSESTLGNPDKKKTHKAQKLSAVTCAKCNDRFFLEKKASIIKCENCGGRILFKVRTNNPIYYKSD